MRNWAAILRQLLQWYPRHSNFTVIFTPADFTIFIEQILKWLMRDQLSSVRLAVVDMDTQKVIENWLFHLDPDLPGSSHSPADEQTRLQNLVAEVTGHIWARPPLEHHCTFDVVVFNANGEDVTPEFESAMLEEGEDDEEDEIDSPQPQQNRPVSTQNDRHSRISDHLNTAGLGSSIASVEDSE